ncbi:hypothetical protein L6452_35916 [Arctium lappa]|uniref:Uncharacterized protein n=1 Tax=Arctium lappa TaxID=4217 RepID=A0ACB8Y711_ARCLA|nr:hypothetical protein L6452_35916 [Arctium lappa]
MVPISNLQNLKISQIFRSTKISQSSEAQRFLKSLGARRFLKSSGARRFLKSSGARRFLTSTGALKISHIFRSPKISQSSGSRRFLICADLSLYSPNLSLISFGGKISSTPTHCIFLTVYLRYLALTWTSSEDQIKYILYHAEELCPSLAQ